MYDDFAETDPVANLRSRPQGDEAGAWTFYEEPAGQIVDRVPRAPAASRKFASVTGAMLAPGVNARETADRDSPGRSATCLALTSRRRLLSLFSGISWTVAPKPFIILLHSFAITTDDDAVEVSQEGGKARCYTGGPERWRC